MAPSALVIAGEPGIGKTTLWLYGVERAREHGFRVLSTRADEAESVLAYAAIADLLQDVEPEVLAGLPELQRVALDRVLLRTGSEGPPTDQRVTGSAVAAVLTAMAATQPILLAVDDVQWLDVSSRAALAFAARRLTGRVGVLLTGRAHATEPDPADWLHLQAPDSVTRVRVGPLSLRALHTMILERFGKAFPRPTMVRIAEVSGGNPFYALELARGVDGRSSVGDAVLPNTLTELVRLRTEHFDGQVGDMLLAACSVGDATVDLVAAATELSVERVVELLEGPEREGIVRIDGNSVVFAHPCWPAASTPTLVLPVAVGCIGPWPPSSRGPNSRPATWRWAPRAPSRPPCTPSTTPPRPPRAVEPRPPRRISTNWPSVSAVTRPLVGSARPNNTCGQARRVGPAG